jgi:hypothetical protein
MDKTNNLLGAALGTNKFNFDPKQCHMAILKMAYETSKKLHIYVEIQNSSYLTHPNSNWHTPYAAIFIIDFLIYS